MSGLGRRPREILERARSADRLSVSARERMSQQLLERLSSDLTPLSGVDSSAVVLPKTSLWLKLTGLISIKGASAGLALLCAGGAVGSFWLRAPSAPPTAAVPTPAAVVSSSPIADVASTRVSELPPAPEPERLTSVPPRNATRPPPPTRRRRPVSPAPTAEPVAPVSSIAVAAPPPTAAITLDAEFELLQRAHAELNAGRAARALHLLEQHVAKFPNAELAQTRDVSLMLALCQLGREPEARARAQRFLVAHPKSPFVGRVRELCP